MLMGMQADSSDEEKVVDFTAEAVLKAQEPAATGTYAQVPIAVSCISSRCLAANAH